MALAAYTNRNLNCDFFPLLFVVRAIAYGQQRDLIRLGLRPIHLLQLRWRRDDMLDFVPSPTKLEKVPQRGG